MLAVKGALSLCRGQAQQPPARSRRSPPGTARRGASPRNAHLQHPHKEQGLGFVPPSVGPGLPRFSMSLWPLLGVAVALPASTPVPRTAPAKSPHAQPQVGWKGLFPSQIYLITLPLLLLSFRENSSIILERPYSTQRGLVPTFHAVQFLFMNKNTNILLFFIISRVHL